MQSETLNIQHHTKILLLKALNKTKYIREAAFLLEISERTVFRYMYQFKVKRSTKAREYYIKEPAILNV